MTASVVIPPAAGPDRRRPGAAAAARTAARGSRILVLPLVALYLVWQVPDGVALQTSVPRLRAHAREGRRAVAPVRDRLRDHGVRRRAVRAQPEPRGRACGGLLLRRQRDRRRLRRRPAHRLHLLGADGDRFDARRLERGAVRARRGTALRRDPPPRRRAADGRHRRRDRGDRLARLRQAWRSTACRAG